MKSRIELYKGDITRLGVDAVVNAANTSLLGGGGVDGAIHRAAGPKLLEECRTLNGCPTGEVRITKGYELCAKYVIHTVGPVWKYGNYKEDELLTSCYIKSLRLAVKLEIKTIAFPAISTGVYNFPLERATRIAVTTVKTFLKNNDSIQKARDLLPGYKQLSNVIKVIDVPSASEGDMLKVYIKANTDFAVAVISEVNQKTN